MKIKTFLFLLALTFVQNAVGQFQKYPQNQIVEDFEYLYKNLEASHYDLFTNTSKRNYDKAYKSTLVSVKDSMSSIQVFRLFQPFVALDQHEHCQILPFNLYGEYYENDGTVFPLNLCFRNDKVYVINNFSSDTTIVPGDEIVSLNGTPITKILDEMLTFFSGESNYLKNVWIEMITFPRSYWMVFGSCEKFKLELKKAQGYLYNCSLNAITTEDYEEKLKMQKPMFDNRREFHFENKNTAYLHPGGFTNLNAKNEHEASDNRKFCQFIDSAFIEMHNLKTQNLIIDLRNNGGGINTFSDYMLTYIADKPFRFSEKFMVRTSKLTKEFWKDVDDSTLFGLKNDIMTKEDGSRFEYTLPYNQPRADSLRFNGKVYVLINRYDLSQAVFTAAMIQDYKFGILVGEETADYSSLFGSSQTFELPNTKLIVEYPKAFIVRPNGNEKAKGVIPEHIVKDDIFSKEDEILEYTLNLIKKGDN